MVDGVSANIGSSAFFLGNGVGGAVGSFNAFGGTNSLVSVDALQEFRIQTSTYAPEFGRTPGGQISIVTRSGENQFHGTVFDYLRNDALDANDWFANKAGLPKPRERQNDFGGTLSGPVLKNRTFFFFSYEGLRLRLPQVALTDVPSVSARQNAAPALQPFLNSFPLPNGPNSGADQAQFNASYSNSASLDAYSGRIDQRIGKKLTIFGRYNGSPSELLQRGFGGAALSELTPVRITTNTATVGAAWSISPATTNDLRFNYSRTNASSSFLLDHFGGAVPLASLGLPSPFSSQDSNLFIGIFSLVDGTYGVGKNVSNLQRQINVVDNIVVQRGSHSLKFGVDFRRLAPVYGPFLYSQAAFFNDVPSAETGSLSFSEVQSDAGVTLLLRNLGIFAQDTWRVIPRLTVTYGLRWDVDFAPSSLSGPSFPAVTGLDLRDLSQLTLAAAGTAPFHTPYKNVAPRAGIAYQLFQNQGWETVLRGGFGVFFDLATQELGNLVHQTAYPFNAINFPAGSFPLDQTSAAPPPITRPGSGSGTVLAFDPSLQLPYTLEWNVALEQALGRKQTLSASYLGSAGRRLIQTADIFSPNANYSQAILVGNSAMSGYNALQIQFQRRLSGGLQALTSYAWSHSIDTASAGSFGNGANAALPALNPVANRGSSDFDIRNAFSAALTYEIPAPRRHAFARAILRSWSLQNVIQARSAPPTNVFDARFSTLFNGHTEVRPDVVPNVPLYLSGPQYPGGEALNPAAFTAPPIGTNGQPSRQGTLSRNALRGFAATQWDFAVHRDFPIRERLKLQFRAEMFNVLNHPNFGPPNGAFGFGGFGVSRQMLGQSLAGGNTGGGALSPLYQLGGPRSIQLALKLAF
jgi:hypothetical protein